MRRVSKESYISRVVKYQGSTGGSRYDDHLGLRSCVSDGCWALHGLGSELLLSATNRRDLPNRRKRYSRQFRDAIRKPEGCNIKVGVTVFVRVMRGEHQNSSTGLKAVKSPMMNVSIMFCDRAVLGLHSNNLRYLYLFSNSMLRPRRVMTG